MLSIKFSMIELGRGSLKFAATCEAGSSPRLAGSENIRRFVSDPLFYPPRVAAVRPLRAAGAWSDGARDAPSDHPLSSRKLEHGGAGSG